MLDFGLLALKKTGQSSLYYICFLMYAETMSNVSYTETFLDFEGADSF